MNGDEEIEFEHGLEMDDGNHEEVKDAERDGLLKAQLGIYGRGMAALAGGRRKGGARKGRGRRHEADSELDEEETAEAKEAEARRRSRAKKAEQLKRALENDEADEPSLLERLNAGKSKRRSRRRSQAVDAHPYPLAIWVYFLFAIVSLDRLVKFASQHADPVMISKVLGAVLIAASFGIKLPQIASLWESKTVTGLSPARFYTDVVSFLLMTVYHVANGTPFTAWGDNAAVLAQDMILVGLIWHFGRAPWPLQVGLSAAFAALTGGLVFATMQVRPSQLWPLPILSTVIALSGTIPQIVVNEQNKHTGAQSFITQLMLTLGSLARVFTTFSEMNDPIVLVSFALSVIVQGALLAQIVYYWGNTKKVLRRERKKSD